MRVGSARPLAIVVAAVAFAFALVAGAAGAATDALVDAYMAKSGLAEQLAGIEAGVVAGIDDAQSGPQGPRLSAEQKEALRRAAHWAFGAERLRRAVHAELAATLPVRETEQVLEWLGTPLGRRVTALESRAAAPDAQQQLAESGAKALAAMPEPRRSLLERALAASGAVDVVASIVVNQHFGVMRGLEKSIGGPSDQGGDDAKAKLDALRGQIAGAIAPTLLATSAAVYAPLSDAELAEYAAMLELPGSRRVSEATGRALDKALSAAAVEFGRRIGDSAKAPSTTT